MVSGLNTWNECYLQIEWAVEVCSCPKSYVQLIVSFLNKQVGAPTVPSFGRHFKASFVIGQIMSNHVIDVKSRSSCQIMSFMSNHEIHVKSCNSCQIMLFMSNNVIIHVK
jgi:hypothetical protein